MCMCTQYNSWDFDYEYSSNDFELLVFSEHAITTLQRDIVVGVPICVVCACEESFTRFVIFR